MCIRDRLHTKQYTFVFCLIKKFNLARTQLEVCKFNLALEERAIIRNHFGRGSININLNLVGYKYCWRQETKRKEASLNK